MTDIHTSAALPAGTPFDPAHALPAGVNGELAEQVERRVRQVEAHVRARPFVTIAIAALTGFVLGRILRD